MIKLSKKIRKMIGAQEQLQKDVLLKEHMLNAKTLGDEIKLRTTTLTQRCKSDHLENLCDHQIFEH